jgi:hypothetical protein
LDNIKENHFTKLSLKTPIVFFAYERGEFTRSIDLLSEANKMVKKATSTKAPPVGGEKKAAEYSIDPFT